MASYALDIENLKVIAAMQELGIVKEELITRSFEDFADPHISHSIQKLRYDHHMKMLRNAVSEIKEMLKKKHITIMPNESKMTYANSIEGSVSLKHFADSKKLLYKREHEILKQTISESNPPMKSPKLQKNSDSQEFGFEAPKKNYKESFKKNKEKQETRFKDIQRSQLKSQQALNDKFSKSMKEHFKRELEIEQAKRQAAKNKEEQYQKKYEQIQYNKMLQEQMFEDAIAQKLQRFENKIQRSEEIHSDAIQEKIEKTQKFKEQFDKVQGRLEDLRKTNELEIVKRLVGKNENVKQHRERTEEEIFKKNLKRKERFEKQRSEALVKIRRAEDEFIARSRLTEGDYLKAQKLYSERKMKIFEEMMIRREEKRLKDLECLTKVQRAKRRFGAKNSQGLQRTLEKYQKIDEFKSAREQHIYSVRDTAIKAMIEKEKIQEAVAIIWKSPRSRTAQEKLKSLNWFPREEEVELSDEQDIKR